MKIILKKSAGAPDIWLTSWLDKVADGELTMSARGASIVAKHGGLLLAKKEARRRRLHLLLLRDDHGRELVAASKEAFKIIC